MPESQHTPTDEERRFLTFRLDQSLYALPAEDVLEVIRTPHLARVPLAPRALMGLANLRGTVLPLASLRGLLGGDEQTDKSKRAIVLAGSSPAALAVDSVSALISIKANKIDTVQADLAAGKDEKLTGAFEVEGQGAAKILNVKMLLDQAFARRSARQTGPAFANSSSSRVEDVSANVETDRFVTFDVAGQEYGLALTSVAEVVAAPDTIARVAQSESVVLGMMALRDRLLPLLSLRGLLGFPQSSPSGLERVLVTRIGGAIVGLVADHTRAIVSARKDRIDPLPAVLAARSGGEAKIKAVYRDETGLRLISILDAEQLFREDVMERLGVAKANGAEEAAAKPAGREKQFLVFRLGADEFGLPIEAVEEVARVPEKITRLPKTPKFLEGVVNVRGDALPVLDQRRRFDMPPCDDRDNRRLIVVTTERHRAALIVDSVSEVYRSTEAAIEQPPELTEDIAKLVFGIVNITEQERIILLLDPAELLTHAERGLLDRFEGPARAHS